MQPPFVLVEYDKKKTKSIPCGSKVWVIMSRKHRSACQHVLTFDPSDVI